MSSLDDDDEDADSLILQATSTGKDVNEILVHDMQQEVSQLRSRLEHSEARRRFLELLSMDLLQRDCEKSADMASLEDLCGRLRNNLLMDHSSSPQLLLMEPPTSTSPKNAPLAALGFASGTAVSPGGGGDASAVSRAAAALASLVDAAGGEDVSLSNTQKFGSDARLPADQDYDNDDDVHAAAANEKDTETPAPTPAPAGVNESLPRAEEQQRQQQLHFPVEAITDRAETPATCEQTPNRNSGAAAAATLTPRPDDRNTIVSPPNRSSSSSQAQKQEEELLVNDSFVVPHREVKFLADDVVAVAPEDFFDPVQRDFRLDDGGGLASPQSASVSHLVSPTFIRHTHDADSYAAVSVPQAAARGEDHKQKHAMSNSGSLSLSISPMASSALAAVPISQQQQQQQQLEQQKKIETCSVGVGTDELAAEPCAVVAHAAAGRVDSAVGPSTPCISDISSIANDEEENHHVAAAAAHPPGRRPQHPTASSTQKKHHQRKSAFASSSIKSPSSPPGKRVPAPASKVSSTSVRRRANTALHYPDPRRNQRDGDDDDDDDDDDPTSSPGGSRPRSGTTTTTGLNITPSRVRIQRLREQRAKVADEKRRAAHADSSSDSESDCDFSLHRPRRPSLCQPAWNADPRVTVPPKPAEGSGAARPPVVDPLLHCFVPAPAPTAIASGVFHVDPSAEVASPPAARRRASSTVHGPRSPGDTAGASSSVVDLESGEDSFEANSRSRSATFTAFQQQHHQQPHSPNRGAMPPPRSRSPPAETWSGGGGKSAAVSEKSPAPRRRSVSEKQQDHAHQHHHDHVSCSKCGHKNKKLQDGTTRFCGFCGKSLPQQQPSAPASVSPAPTPPVSNQ